MASIFDLLKQVNLGDSGYFMDGSARARSNYAPVVDAVVRPVSGGSFWDRLKNRSSDWLSNPENLFKLGAGGLGATAGYLSARAAAKQGARRQQFQEQAYAQQLARTQAVDAERAKYNDPRVYKSTRQRVAAPMVLPSGETVYFDGNQLTGEQEDPGVKSIFAAEGGPIGYLAGGTAGQDDKIPAMLSDGEFVFDADTVAALGDGNNAAGASALEQMRQNIRKHKRGAAPDKIPPKAKKPEQYMKKANRYAEGGGVDGSEYERPLFGVDWSQGDQYAGLGGWMTQRAREALLKRLAGITPGRGELSREASHRPLGTPSSDPAQAYFDRKLAERIAQEAELKKGKK